MKAAAFALAMYLGMAAAFANPYPRDSDRAIDAVAAGDAIATGDNVSLNDLDILDNNGIADFSTDRAGISDAVDTSIAEDGNDIAPQGDLENFNPMRAVAKPVAINEYDKHVLVKARATNIFTCINQFLGEGGKQCDAKFPAEKEKCRNEAKRASGYCLRGLGLKPMRLLTVFTYPPIRIARTLTKDKECMSYALNGVLVDWCDLAYGQKGLEAWAALKNCQDAVDKVVLECRAAVADKKKGKYDYKFDLQTIKQTGPGLVLPDIPPGK
ncbi:hypothetical protein HDU96_008101 [Phlyctochytrium bullatum]|nr:hypothetical protein HDU96_008101 [Phlyctochytrium bullatum]